MMKLHRPRPEKDFDISVIIVNYNTWDHLDKCLESLYKYHPDCKLQVIVVDNNSTVERSHDFSAKYSGVSLHVSDTNLGFAAANNLALSLCHSENILYLNPDVIFVENVFPILIDTLNIHKRVGAVCCKATDLFGSVQKLPLQNFPSPWIELLKILFYSNRTSSLFRFSHLFHSPETSGYLSYVHGHFLLMKKKLAEEIGGFDSRFFMYSEDIDLCNNIKNLGYCIYYDSNLQIIHVGSGSLSANNLHFKINTFHNSRYRLISKHLGKAQSKLYALFMFFGSLYRTLLISFALPLLPFSGTSFRKMIFSSISKYIRLLRWSMHAILTEIG